MFDIKKVRELNPQILMIGTHPGIIQSILDFDYLAGKEKPSIIGIAYTNRKFERYFWGNTEILIPGFKEIEHIPQEITQSASLFLNVTSARRVLTRTKEALSVLPHIVGGVVFGENIPEKDAIELYDFAQSKDIFIIGPSSVGLLLPGLVKLGAIGGVEATQLVQSKLFAGGSSAVFSSSGGMTGELIRLMALKNKGISFSLSFGGDRFPAVAPIDAFLAAENDPETSSIVYFGELGGYDEYEIAKLLDEKKVTKKVVAYIAGSISEMFETPPQFGHAKAMAGKDMETAKAKRDVLQKAGAQVASSFTEFVSLIEAIDSPLHETNKDMEQAIATLQKRKPALFVNRISGDKEGEVQVLGKNLLDLVRNNSFAQIVISMLLGRTDISDELVQFTDFIFKLAVDHGPNVSGAVNTMITARAGRDMVSSLAAGLLTVGPRFGGAVNEAAYNWLTGVEKGMNAFNFVESYAREGKLVLGIGHKKYRIDQPDPRVKALLEFKNSLTDATYTNFALEVEKITTTKKGNLILNVDGLIAALLLDFLREKEGYQIHQLKELVDIEFFNAFFILPRSVGFTAHYLDQRRLDEGLFRLPNDLVSSM